jgi:hypothetical protein
MTTELKLEEKAVVADSAFFDVNWDVVAYNKMAKDEFLKIRSRHSKLFATFLGGEGQFQFFMFKPLTWGEYKDIRAKQLDKDATHEYILNMAIVHPKMDPIEINTMEAGVMLTLVQQILGMSNFLKDPNEALKMILKV